MAVIFKPAQNRKNFRWKKFTELGRAIYVEIEYRLMSGDSAASIAQFLQKDCKALLDLKESTLTRYISAFKEQIVHPKILKVYKTIDVAVRGTKRRDLEVKIDALKIIERQIADLMWLVDGLREKQETMGKGLLFPNYSATIKQLTDLSERYFRLQMEAGLIAKLGESALFQVNNTFVTTLQENVKYRDQIAFATQRALEILTRAGVKGLPAPREEIIDVESKSA